MVDRHGWTRKKWYPLPVPLRISDRGARHITNKNGDKLSPWNIPRLIWTFPNETLFTFNTAPCKNLMKKNV